MATESTESTDIIRTGLVWRLDRKAVYSEHLPVQLLFHSYVGDPLE
jgi:hypothetical protein